MLLNRDITPGSDFVLQIGKWKRGAVNGERHISWTGKERLSLLQNLWREAQGRSRETTGEEGVWICPVLLTQATPAFC